MVGFALALQAGARLDTTLAAVLGFRARLPDSQRTHGPTLDRDFPQAPRTEARSDPATMAQRSLLERFRRRGGGG